MCSFSKELVGNVWLDITSDHSVLSDNIRVVVLEFIRGLLDS